MVRDLEEPLRQLAPLDRCARAPAAAVLDLLVCQHGHIDRVPVHHSVFAVDQPLFEEVQKQRLLLAVVAGVAGGDLARPVDREAERLHLFFHLSDIGIGPIRRVATDGHRCVFGGHTKGIPAHRVQHVMPRCDLVARDYVAHRVVAHMAHMDPARRIGEHLKHIVFRLVSVAGGLKDAILFPGLLPAGFDLGGDIAGHEGTFVT